jgi:hypothetical protein
MHQSSYKNQSELVHVVFQLESHKLQVLRSNYSHHCVQNRLPAIQWYWRVQEYVELYLRCRYWIDEASAETVDQRVQKGLFLFACTNSCMNPIVYGYFNFRSGRGSGYTAPGGRAAQQVRYINSTTTSKNRHNSLAGLHWHWCRGSTYTLSSLACSALWDFSFSWRQVWRCLSSGMLHYVVYKLTDVSEVLTVHRPDDGSSEHL